MQFHIFNHSFNSVHKYIKLISVLVVGMYSSFALAQTNLTVLAETNFQNGILFYAQKHELFKKAGINVQIVAPHATNQNIFSQAEQHKSQVVFSSEFQFLTSKLAQQKSYKIIANTLFETLANASVMIPLPGPISITTSF